MLDALQRRSLAIEDVGQLTSELTGFYGDLFCRLFADDETFAEHYAVLVKTLAVAYAPVSFDLLLRVYACPPELLHRRLLTLWTYLKVSGKGECASYALFHKSLADWLCDQESAGPYWCDAKSGHA